MAQSPLVAVLASSSANSRLQQRGFQSLSHLLAPFATHDVSIREPTSGQTINSNVRLDIRDITKDGHLLSLSVLPHVLHQALQNADNVEDALEKFENVLSRWAEPADQEALAIYLASIFVVSVSDENPLGELSKLIQTQQTLHHPGSTNVIPPYCSMPKWVSSHPKSLKHYILLQDELVDDASRTSHFYEQMCSTYGKECCQVLRLSANNSEVEKSIKKSWNTFDELNMFLTRGLEDARNHAASSIAATSTTLAPNSSSSSVSTISSTFPRVSPNPDLSSSPKVSRSESNFPLFQFPNRTFSEADATECTSVLKKFVSEALVPYVEREMRHLLEQIGTRRGIIGKSITSNMKKWFTAGTVQSTVSSPSSYSWDCTEMQVRRLADLAFVFGIYSLAYQQYRSVKKDFESDQAMIHHALASEMCAVALNFSQSHLTAKAFPVHYFENALQFLLSNGGKYSSVIRCAFNASRVLSKLGLKKEAAMMLSKLSALDGDQLVAIAQSEAAQKFENSGMKRKAAFYRVLAGNRFANAAIPPLAFDSYRLAFPTLGEDHWGVIEEHLSVKLLTEGSKTNGKLKAPMAFECVRRLVRVCPQLGEQQQHQRLALLVQILTNFTAENESARLDLPTVESKNISVICGERPLWDDTAKEEGEVGHDEWISIERAAHHALYGSSAPFRGMQLVSNAYTDNQKIRETPIGERFRVRFELRNPLSVRLTLRNVRLSVADVHAKDVPVDQCLQAEHVELVQIEPLEKVTLELVVRPLEGCTKFKVDGILGRLEIDENLGIHIKVPVEIKGKRLNKTPKQQKSVVYAADERLHATVSTRSWPLLDIRTLKGAPSFAYCDQAVRYVFEMENIGAETVSAMTVATNGFDCVSAGWMDENSTRIPISRSFAANSSSIVVFNFTSPEGVPLIRVGEKKRMFIDVRMAATETSSTAFDSAETRRGPTAMLVAYRGEFGSMREWRRVVDVRRKRLLNVRSTLLDESKGLFSLSFRNCVATNEAALSRVEILRIRAASSDPATSRNAVKLAMMTSRKVEIESEQSDVICLSMTSAEDEAQNELWLSKNVDFPAWPCPIPAQNDETACKRQIGVFWKASVVDNEGHVSSLLGESFVDDPFEKADSVHPGEEESKKEANILISCDVEKLVSHDFKSQRMCEVPMQVKIKNVDAKGRDAKINVKFVSKVREPISGVHLLPPETRQQLWIDRPERKLTLRGHEEKSFRLKVRMAQASVYDVGGAQLQIEALFEGEDPAAVHKFKVPNLLSVVKAV